MTKSEPETYSEQETDARREATLKAVLGTPHRPHNTRETGKDGKRAKAKQP